METSTVTLEGVPLVVPTLTNGTPLLLPFDSYEDFEHYCGAGKFGTALVPDHIYFLKVSPACYIHDISWTLADATRADFDQTNRMFLNNLISIINHRSSWWLPKMIRRYRAMTYYNAVQNVGLHLFEKLKGTTLEGT